MALKNVFILVVTFYIGMASAAPYNTTTSTNSKITAPMKATSPVNPTSPVNATSPSAATQVNGSLSFSLQSRNAQSGISFVIHSLLKTSAKTTLDMMIKKYPFIGDKKTQLLVPITFLGLRNRDIDTCGINNIHMSVVEQFQFLFHQFSTFVDPLNLACDYEAVPLNSKNDAMSRSVNITRIYLYDTVRELRQILIKRKVSIPTFTKLTESVLNSATKIYLTALQKFQQGVPPTDTNVKIYRNYIIVYAIQSIIQDIYFFSCIPE